MSEVIMTAKDRFLAGHEFVGKRSSLHRYRYDKDGGVEMLNYGHTTEWVFYALADKVNDEGFTIYLMPLGMKGIKYRGKFAELKFINQTEAGS